MSRRQTREQLLVRDEIVAAPAKRACEDQTFELPTAIYIAMATMLAGFIAVLSLSFRGGHMAVVYGVIFAFIVAFFAVPALFPGQASEESRTKALSLFDFGHRGIATATGRASARSNHPRLAASIPHSLLRNFCRNDRVPDPITS
jgi:predicted RND superfamily exporter protein